MKGDMGDRGVRALLEISLRLELEFGYKISEKMQTENHSLIDSCRRTVSIFESEIDTIVLTISVNLTWNWSSCPYQHFVLKLALGRYFGTTELKMIPVPLAVSKRTIQGSV